MIEYNPFSLKGKTVLVTGASSGIGAATAIECSKMGAQVIITARNEERLKETFNQMVDEGHQIVSSDLTNQEDVENLVGGLSKINGVVLCAGVGYTLPFPFCSRKKMDEVFNINFFAPIELLRLLIKKKKMETNSSVVFVSSVGGVNVFNVGNSIYGASKGALNSMMKQTALELAAKNIRVNSVNPGMVNTKLIHEGMSITDEQLKEDEKRYPLGRYGEPTEIAKGILFLLSDASCWMTGHSMVIDGGLSLI
jgi:NAD(P)-dependent dehydrogenase (short-subunit alcohol dehydrogenase family)